MKRFALATLVLVVITALTWLWLNSADQPQPEPQTSQTSNSTSKLDSNTPASPAYPTKTPSTQSKQPLDLSISSPDSAPDSDSVQTHSENGPLLPQQQTDLSAEQRSQLPEQSKKADTELLYKYKGQQDDNKQLMLGIEKDGVTIKTDVDANTDQREAEVQYIEVEIKLP